MTENAISGRNQWNYVAVTAARNEEKHIEKTLHSVAAQTVRPLRWVVVSDASTDQTDEIVREYAQQYRFIQLHQITEDHPRNFAAQVHAINLGCSLLQDLEYSYIGNLDSDISFGPSYFENLLKRFHQYPDLGLAGGYICEERDGEFKPRPLNNVDSVAHAVQLFRRECFEALGSYLPLPHGGPDWHAEVTARMHGWTVRSFPDLQVYHHRPTGSAEGRLRSWYRQGLMDYSLGSHPLFEIAKMGRRLRTHPPILGALVRLCAYGWACCRQEDRIVSNEFVKFLRREQMGRLLSFGGTLRGNRSGAGRGGELKKSDGRI